jgi:hypothetical protein
MIKITLTESDYTGETKEYTIEDSSYYDSISADKLIDIVKEIFKAKYSSDVADKYFCDGCADGAKSE